MLRESIQRLNVLFTSFANMSSQYRNPQEDNNNKNNNNNINNNTALITMPKERQQEEEVDQADNHTIVVGEQNNRDLITILNSADFEQLLPLAESFILSKISHLHSLYIQDLS